MTGFAVTPGLDHLLPAYVAEMAADGDRLRALAVGPDDDLAYHAHGMGGKCAMIGDQELAQALYDLEALILSGHGDRVPQALARIGLLLDRLKPQG